MRRALAVLVGGIVTTALGSCSSLPFLSGGGGDEPAGEEPVAEQPVAAPETAAEEPADFEDPVVAVAPPPPPKLLIAATDPDARLKSLAAGRVDPFAPSEIPITVKIPDPPPPEPVADPNGGGPGGGPGGGSGTGPGPGPGSSPPDGPVAIPAPPVLGPLPDPFSLVDTSLARGIAVTGVVQVGQTAQAIVKAPGDPTSRYVSVGQRLANGAVLVKRIEVYGSEPVVILEQNGVEVTRFIGEPVEGPTEEGAPPPPDVAG